MDSFELAKNLQHFPNLVPLLQGIYAADNIPQTIKKNHFIICNTDISSGAGKHWYCIVKVESNVLECFDSLGVDGQKKLFLTTHFNQRFISKVKFNVTQVQSSMSSTCGLFVLYFIVNRFHNQDLSFADLLNDIFVASLKENEKRVEIFANENFENE